MENEKGYVKEEKKAVDADKGKNSKSERNFLGNFGNFGLTKWSNGDGYNLGVTRGVINRKQGTYHEQKMTVYPSDKESFRSLCNKIFEVLDRKS